jgi:outer membrane immunogenic protein
MRKFAILFVALAFSGPALAADMTTKMPVKAPPPPPAPVNSWTGFYVGANGGYGWGKSKVSYSPNDLASADLFGLIPGFGPGAGSAFLPTNFATSGGVGGLQLGYNWQFARAWVGGVETDFDWSSVKGSGSSTASAGSLIPVVNSANQKTDWFGTVRARLGYLPMDNLLLFVTGGYAYAHFDQNGNLTNPSPIFGANNTIGAPFSWSCAASSVCFTGSSNNVSSGWTAGGGFEFAVIKNVTLKAEYLYLGFEKQSVTETAQALGLGTLLSTYNANFGSTSINIVRVGLNYKFN